MDLNDVKKQLQQVQAPESGSHIPASGSCPLDNLVAALKAVDARDRRMFWLSTMFFLVAGAFYAALFGLTWFAPPDDFPRLHRVVLSAFATVFLFVGVLHRMKSRSLARVDYAAPVLEFLSAAERRCRFVQPNDLLIIIPFVVLLTIIGSAALMLGLQRYAPTWDPAVVLLICCILYPLSGAMGYWIGYQSWRRKRQPLLEQIHDMQLTLKVQDALHDDKQ